MGLFSSKTKITVGTVAQRAIADDQFTSSVKTGAIKAVLQDGDSIPDYILEELIGCVGMRGERMYDYAKDHYTHGLPYAQIKSATAGRDIAQGILASLEGQPVEIDYYHYGSPNALHIGWTKLTADHGYNPSTNILANLTATKGKNVYLKDMVVVIPAAKVPLMEPGSLDQWGIAANAGYTPQRTQVSLIGLLSAASPVVADPVATEEHLKITYVWERALTVVVTAGIPSPSSEIVEETFTIDLTGIDEEADYFHVKYRVGTTDKYWLYKAGSSTYPSLDDVFDDPVEVAGAFFPFVYFRYNKLSEVTNKTTEAYKTSSKMVKYLGMDYDTVADGIEENPSIADIEQAMLVMAVPAVSSDEADQRYLFTFFDNWFYTNEVQLSDPGVAKAMAAQAKNQDLAKSTIIIQDKRFKMSLSNGGIFKRRVAGNIGEIGSHDAGFYNVDSSQPYTDPVSGEETVVLTPVKYHYYRKQITKSIYEEIKVIDLKMLYHIFENYTATADETDSILLIPLDHGITQEYSISEREYLYARSLHYVFNSKIVTKVKWYQTGIFMLIVAIVAVVIMIVTGNPLIVKIVAAANAGIGALVLTILTSVIIPSLIIQVAFKLFVKLVGVKLAGLIALLAVVASLAGANVGIDLSFIPGAPDSMSLLQLSTNLTSAIGTEIQDMMSGLMDEFKDFELFKDEQNKLIAAGKELLNTSLHLNPFIVFGESPNDFYNRTVHSGNIGLNGISAISSYVDIALTLPEINDTIGAT